MPKKYIITISAVLLAVILITVALTVSFGNDMSVGSIVSDKKDADEPFTLLVIGKDRASGLCDVMMLASLDPENKSLSIMQIPRDTYADYGSKSHKKLNTALKVLGTEERVCGFLSTVLGIRIDGYLTLELDAFRKAVDAIGGVEMYLPERLYYSDPAQKLYIDLPAGNQVLDGRKAEMLIRFRSGYSQGDLDRLDMQKRFLLAFFKQIKSNVDASEVYGLIKSVFPHVRTNVTLPLAAALGVKALSLKSDSLCFMTLPGEAVTGNNGASFFVMSKAPASRALKKYFSTFGELDKEGLLDNETHEKFAKAYRKDFEYSVSFGNEIE